MVEISFNTFVRWRSGKLQDKRKGSSRHIPRKLSEEEREIFYQTANQRRFRDLTPPEIVAILLEEGIYHGSESTLYRILRQKKASIRRSESRIPGKAKRPQELVATGPNQIWTWDITWLKTEVKGLFLYAYVVLDIYSRKVVGWAVHESESPDHARDLFERTIQDLRAKPKFLHADNGGPMKGLTLVAFLTQLRVGLSYSRPRVSDDNPYIESWFKTVKYHVSYPQFFRDLPHARKWFADFVAWYNTEHRHSGILYVTPHQRHMGKDMEILSERQKTLDEAARRLMNRFVRGPRRFTPIQQVVLNKSA